MQTRQDTLHNTDSLDDDFWLQGAGSREYVAILPQRKRTPEFLEIKTGDQLTGVSNRFNGLTIAKNLRTNQQGIIASFKVIERLIPVNNISISI